ncbi:DUF4270 family protein [Bacteroidota bacterium]
MTPNLLLPGRIHVYLILLLLIVVASCKKEPDKIGLDLQSPEENINVYYNDQTAIRSYSVQEDSVRSDETSVSLLGTYLDPVFGRSTAALNTSVRLSANGHNFGTNPVLDSIIMIFEYADYYGDTLSQLSLKAFKLTEKIEFDSSYYSNDLIQYDAGVEMANKTFYPRPKTLYDTSSVSINKELPQLHIRLADQLGNEFLSAPSSVYVDNTAFLDWFYGLRFEIDSMATPGSILSFKLISSHSRMIIYYSNDAQSELDFEFIINDNTARFANFYHNFGSSQDNDFKQQVLYHDTTLGEYKLYLQPMGGVRTKIHFPGLTDLAAGKTIAINEAKLVINGLDDLLDNPVPSSLALVRIVEDGKIGLLIDQFEPYFGGGYDSIHNQYTFRITRHIQALFSGDVKDYGLYLFISLGSLQAKRFILAGPNPQAPILPEKRFKLNITYTEVD